MAGTFATHAVATLEHGQRGRVACPLARAAHQWNGCRVPFPGSSLPHVKSRGFNLAIVKGAIPALAVLISVGGFNAPFIVLLACQTIMTTVAQATHAAATLEHGQSGRVACPLARAAHEHKLAPRLPEVHGWRFV